jgi:acetyl-CoA C-acetyltransferase
VTGGLPYFGGPGNDYTTHGIAAMCDRLRAGDGTIGVVTGVGW